MARFLAQATVCFSLLISLMACTVAAAPTPETAVSDPDGRALVLGDISDEAAETIKGTQPTADYLAARLSEFGINRGEVKIAPDLDTMIRWMGSGEVDLYFDSPYPALVISQETGAMPILRRLKYGVPQYHSVFFSRASSDFGSVQDLTGQTIAFEEPFSTSGYMLPLAYLLEQGVHPVEKESLETAVSSGEVGYVFSTADNTTVQWVISGLAPAGVTDNVTFSRLPAETQAELAVFAETEDVPRQLVLVRAGLDEALVAKIKSELLAMDENEAGQAALETFLTTEFTEFPEGPEKALARMQQIYQMVQAEK
ncbi:MAG: phosphate/phosphite/phosphonate ABC transporter substrate-binding protein [Anaerolineales bacterium]|nr:phosphate/phosphite/phosphonate ABC transporter substrate-binding protein [Anaerolineales bacterium]